MTKRQTLKDLYLYLPSNTKHTDNNPRVFIVLLAQPYEPVGEWEVGLMEIQYVRMWYNAHLDQFVHFGNTTTLYPGGIYTDTIYKDIIKTLNKKLNGALVQTLLSLLNSIPSKPHKKMRLKITRNESSEDFPLDLYISKRLSDMLAFVKTGWHTQLACVL